MDNKLDMPDIPNAQKIRDRITKRWTVEDMKSQIDILHEQKMKKVVQTDGRTDGLTNKQQLYSKM